MPITEPKAVLFDSDGTLVDSESVFFETTREVLSVAGVELRAEQWARWYLGESRNTADILDMLGVSRETAERLREQRNLLFHKRIEHGVPLRPGAYEILTWLRPRAKLAVVTGASREHFNRVHHGSGLSALFDVVVTSDECSVSKPAPDAYLQALNQLGLKASECVAIEDSPRGARAALAAGLRCAIVPTPLTDMTLCPPPCRVFARLDELMLLFQDIGETTNSSNSLGRHHE